MTRSSTRLNVGIGGHLIEDELLTDENGDPVHRQTLQIGGKLVAQVAEVKDTAPDGTENGLYVWLVGGNLRPSADAAVWTRVLVGTTATTLLAANAARKGYTIQMEFDAPDVTRLKEGSGASFSDGGKDIQPGGNWEPPINYTGIVTAIAADTGGYALIGEY